MNVLITAGPTREYIDRVRFISNASSGAMGVALANAAHDAGHQVTLLMGQGAATGEKIPDAITFERFTSVSQLKEKLTRHFPDCDALFMAAAVGDFQVETPVEGKISRSAGPITLRLIPTEDVLAGLASTKRPHQRIIAFAVEEGREEEILLKARDEMLRKHADYTVLNTPDAMAASTSRACVLSRKAIEIPWALREKSELASALIRLLG